jgi:nucleoside-diphosphate-sugar epimerase
MELTVVNPVAVFGPVLSKDFAPSVIIVERMMNGDLYAPQPLHRIRAVSHMLIHYRPGLPRLAFCVVDVRDVADLHIRAMTDPKAAGQRYIASASNAMWFKDVAVALKSKLGPKASRVKTWQLPDMLVKLVSFFDSEVALVTPGECKLSCRPHDRARTI